MTGRGKFTIRNPAEAVAVAKCWLAGWHRGIDIEGLPNPNDYHPGVCTWCQYPRDLLVQALEEFADWAGLFKEEAAARLEVESFLALPSDEQARLVRKSAGGVEEPPPREGKVREWWTD